MKYCYIINPIAGQKELPAKLIPLIEDGFKHSNLDYEIAVTQHPKHASEITRQLAKTNEAVRICAMGGDGTLNEVVSGAIGFDNVEVGCYPSGSGNDFIKYFGTREDFIDFEYIVDAPSVELDVIKINDRYCLNIFSLGIDANVAYDIPHYRRLPLMSGPMAYNLSLAVNFVKKLGSKITLFANDSDYTFDCLLLAVGNGRVYGGGYYAAPEAIADDGLLDIVAVKTIPRLRIASVIPVYKKGKHLIGGKVVESLRDVITYFRTDKLRISADSEIVVNLDGESARMKDMEISVIHKGIRFLVPTHLTSKEAAPGFVTFGEHGRGKKEPTL